MSLLNDLAVSGLLPTPTANDAKNVTLPASQGIRYGYNSDEYAHLWHFAMTSDELKSEAMKIYILRRVAELKGNRK